MLPSKIVKLIGQNQATEATTIKIATTETTFTTTGTEITSVTTSIKEITTKEWELKTQEQQYQEFVSDVQQVKKKVTKQRTVVKEVPGPQQNLPRDYIYRKPGSGTVIFSFVASKFGGTIDISRGGQQAAGSVALERYLNNTWTRLQSGGSGQGLTRFLYTYPASNETQFQFVNLSGGGDISLGGNYPTSIEQSTIENYEEEITVTEDKSRYEPRTQTIYKVDSTTNTTTKEEVITDVEIEEKTTSITKSLFNPKPSALMRMDQLFNLPGSINSPTIDLLSFIQDDINS